MAATQKKKMQFQGALGFPLPLPGGVLRFDPQRLPAYLENNERGAGGWYPLGANQTWHNGIHLHGAGGAPAIHAVADGTIVAARLTQDWDKELHPFGSNCFVLLRHDVTLCTRSRGPSTASSRRSPRSRAARRWARSWSSSGRPSRRRSGRTTTSTSA